MCALPSITYCIVKHSLRIVSERARHAEGEPKIELRHTKKNAHAENTKFCKRETTRTEVKLNALRRVVVEVLDFLLSLSLARDSTRCSRALHRVIHQNSHYPLWSTQSNGICNCYTCDDGQRSPSFSRVFFAAARFVSVLSSCRFLFVDIVCPCATAYYVMRRNLLYFYHLLFNGAFIHTIFFLRVTHASTQSVAHTQEKREQINTFRDDDYVSICEI